MRFLMLNWRDPHNPNAGGAERASQAHLSALARRGHEVFWFSYAVRDRPATESIDGVRIVRAGGFCTSLVEAIAWYRQQPRFDLVIDQHHGIPWYAPWWSGTRSVSYIHEVLGPIWESFYPWPLSRWGQFQENWTQRLYRNVPFWTVCETTKKLLLAQGIQDVTVLYNGVGTQALPSLPPKPLNLPLRLAAVSRIAQNKRVDHAIQAVRILREKGVPTQLTVVGSGDLNRQLEGLAMRLGLSEHVRFTGGIAEPEKDAVLRDAHFLVHTSLREGWGLNVIEANALGTPAAVYPVCGLTESTLAGVTGLVTSEESPESLAGALAAIMGRPDFYQKLRRAAWERAKQLHWDQVLPQACDWLEDKAKNQPGAGS